MHCFKLSADTILAQFDAKICFALYKAAFLRFRMSFMVWASWTGLYSSACKGEVYLEIPTFGLVFVQQRESLTDSDQAVWKQVGREALHSAVPSISPFPQLKHYSSPINITKTVKKILWAPHLQN